MNHKTGRVFATSASVLVSVALTLGLAPASSAAIPSAPSSISSAVSTSVSATQVSTVSPVSIPTTVVRPMVAQSDWYAAESLRIINKYRSDRGMGPLQWSQPIADVSQGWANHLGEAMKNPYFDWSGIHRSDAGGSLIPSGATWYREVVVFSFTPQQSVDWWMGSPGHRDAIMSPKATHIGMGHVTPTSGPYKGWNQMVANLAAYPSAAPAPAPTPAPSHGSVIGTAKTTFDVNFRSGPSTGYPSYQMVPQGSTVNVHGSSVNGWTPVSFNGKSGYISSPYLTATVATPAPAPTPPPVLTPAPVNEQVIGTTTTNTYVNFRSGPSTGSTVFELVNPGTKVNVLSNSVNGWTKASYNGRTGYFFSQYLNATSAIPAPTPAPAPAPVVDKVIGTAKTIYAVNHRAGTSTSTGILQMIPQNATVNLLGASVDGWTKVSYNGKTGYVSSPYLQSTTVAAPAQTIASTIYAVNFRSGPSTGYSVLQVVPQGAKVTVLAASSGGWTKVSYNGKTGYISSDYLR